MIPKKTKLELIEWEDSYNNDMSWKLIKDIPDPAPMICASVGWVIKETKKNIIIAPHISDIKEYRTLGTTCGCLTIPKSAIIKRKILKY